MAAYDYTQPADASVEAIAKNFRTAGVDSRALLWTAHYAVAGANTITIQFPATLQSASTTAADYTLSGPSAPSISSVSFSAGSRSIQLNLSGPLSSNNAYTLSIKDNKVLSYLNHNWPKLVVDVFYPATTGTTGVGIAQEIAVGSPAAVVADPPFVPPGIEQIVDLGVPDIAIVSSQDTFGVGIVQPVDAGTPEAHLQTNTNGVGIAQPVDIGTPLVSVRLALTAQQKAALIDLDTALHQAYSDGVAKVGFPDTIDAVTGYKNDMPTLRQDQLRLEFKLAAAAAISTFNIPGALPATNDSDSVTLAKVNNLGSAGSLSFVDGILVSKVDPT